MNESVGPGFRERLEARTRGVVRTRRRLRRLAQGSAAGVLYLAGVLSSGWWGGADAGMDPATSPGGTLATPAQHPAPDGRTPPPTDLVAAVEYYDELLDREEDEGLAEGGSDHWLMIALRDDRRAGGRR